MTIAQVVVIGIFAVLCQVASLIGMVDFVTITLSLDARLPQLATWAAAKPEQFLYGAPLLIMVLLLCASGLHYFARDLVIKTMILHERRCIDVLLERLHNASHLPAGLYTHTDMVRAISRDIRYYGRLVDALLESCLPIVFFLGAFFFLLFLSPNVSVFVVLAIGVFLAGFIILSKRISELGLRLESSAKHDVAARTQAIHRALLDRNESHKQQALEDVRQDSEINEFLSVYAKRLRISIQAVLFSSIFISVLVGVVLIYLGSELYAGRNIIADVLIYIVALNYCLMQVRSFAAIFAKFRVFEPFAIRYLNFLDGISTRERHTEESVFRINAAPLYDGSGSVTQVIEAGDCIAVTLTKPLNKVVLGEICYSLGVDPAINLIPRIIYRYIPEELGGMQKLLEHHQTIEPTLLDQLHCTALREMIESDILEAKKSVETEDYWDIVHRRTGFALQIIEAALDEQCNFVLIEGKGFRGIRQPAQAEIKQMLSDKIQVLTYPNPPPKPIFDVLYFFPLQEPSEADAIELDDDLETA